MSYHTGDTICAIGTAVGGAARGMIRISGPAAVAITQRVFAATDGRDVAEARMPSVVEGWLHVSFGGNSSEQPLPVPPCKRGELRVPCDLFLWPNERSYTREPVVELHTIGSQPVLRAVVDGLCRSGARLAEPGEFTLRAFLAGRIDLTQAEAVLGVIDSRGDDELHVALAQLAGGLARPLQELRDQLLQLLAELEAGLDFVDDDIRFISQQDTVDRLREAHSQLAEIARQFSSRSVTRELPQVVLSGRPNVGKSSLFNALVKRCGTAADRTQQPASAIVSEVRGTTRDYLTAPIVVGSMPCELVDTAGIEEWDVIATDSIAALAQGAALDRRQQASIRLLCIECRGAESADFSMAISGAEDCDAVILTKSDLCALPYIEQLCERLANQLRVPVLPTSCRSGAGIANLERQLAILLTRDSDSSCGKVLWSTAERCHESVRLAAAAIESATKLTIHSSGDELVAAEIRLALAELGKMVGTVYTDDLLDRIFKTFCIGK